MQEDNGAKNKIRGDCMGLGTRYGKILVQLFEAQYKVRLLCIAQGAGTREDCCARHKVKVDFGARHKKKRLYLKAYG